MAKSFQQISEERSLKKQQDTDLSNEINDQSSNIDNIKNNIPEDQKAKGSSNSWKSIYNTGKIIYFTYIPLLYRYSKELGIEDEIKKIQETQDEIDSKTQEKLQDIQSLINNVCPLSDITQDIINKRNQLVQQLNLTGSNVRFLNSLIDGQLNIYDLTLSLLEKIKITQKATSIAAKVIPAPPGIPGAIPSILNDLIATQVSILFSDDGNPKLAKIKKDIEAALLPLALISSYIKTALQILTSIDAVLSFCRPDSTLVPIDSTLTDIYNQLNASTNNSTYKGFTLEIEEVPFNNTISRRKAVAFDKTGVKVIETELSFTTTPQILIQELKFIIDRDNLKS